MNRNHFTLLALLSSGVSAPAAIIHVAIPEEEQLFLGLGEAITRDFDFNKDNTADLRFTASRDGFVVTALHNEAGITTGYLNRNNFLGTTAVPLIRGMVVERYSEDFSRDPFAMGITPGGLGHTYLLSFGALDGGVGGAWYGEEAYLGFALSAGPSGEAPFSEFNFGWLRLREFLGAGGYFIEYAYETESDLPISAGAIPEPTTSFLSLIGLSILGFRRRKNTSKPSSRPVVPTKSSPESAPNAKPTPSTPPASSFQMSD